MLAALNGHAIGGGLELALSCDLRVCSADARLGMPPARLGLVYSHTGLRKFLDATRRPAHARAVLHRAHDQRAGGARLGRSSARCCRRATWRARGVELAAEIAANAPLSLAGNKRVIRVLLGRRGHSTRREAELVALREACFRSEDFREGVRAFAEKRAPRWQGR